MPSRSLVLGDVEGFARAVDHQLLQALALGPVGDRDQRQLHVAEAGDDRLAIDLQQLDLPALGNSNCPSSRKPSNTGCATLAARL